MPQPRVVGAASRHGHGRQGAGLRPQRQPLSLQRAWYGLAPSSDKVPTAQPSAPPPRPMGFRRERPMTHVIQTMIRGGRRIAACTSTRTVATRPGSSRPTGITRHSTGSSPAICCQWQRAGAPKFPDPAKLPLALGVRRSWCAAPRWCSCRRENRTRWTVRRR